jgi:hypothetical protein
MTPALNAVSSHQHGVFTRAQALAAGVSPDEFRRHVDRRIWHRIRRGAYTTTEAWAEAMPADRQKLALQAATLQMDAPVVGSHETAAAIHGIELWEPSYEWINITRPDHSARREGGVWHHHASLPDDEVCVVDGLQLTSMIRTGLDVARGQRDHEHALVAVDSALRALGGTYEERAVALAAMRALHLDRADWPGARIAGGAVAAADPRCGSVGESRTRVRLAELGLPEPQSQVYVFDEAGRLVGIADFAIKEYKTLIEFDGRSKYGLDGLTADAMADRLWSEKLRQGRLQRLRWVVVRIVWSDLYHPERILAKVRAAFAEAAASGPILGSISLSPR